VHERDHPAKDFGDAAAGAGRVDVDDAPALQALGELPQPMHFWMADHFLVAVQQVHDDFSVATRLGSAIRWRKASMSERRTWLRLRKLRSRARMRAIRAGSASSASSQAEMSSACPCRRRRAS